MRAWLGSMSSRRRDHRNQRGRLGFDRRRARLLAVPLHKLRLTLGRLLHGARGVRGTHRYSDGFDVGELCFGRGSSIGCCRHCSRGRSLRPLGAEESAQPEHRRHNDHQSGDQAQNDGAHLLVEPAIIVSGQGLAPGGRDRHRFIVMAEFERRRVGRQRVRERRKPIRCRRNRAPGSSGRDEAGKVGQRGVRRRATLVGLILGDQGCQQLRQLLRQAADRRAQKWVIGVQVVGHHGPLIAIR